MFKKLLLLAAVITPCALLLRADNIVDEIVARVNDSIITRADLQHSTQATQEEIRQQYPAEWQSRWAVAQANVLRDLIDQKLLLDKGKELGVTGDTELIKRLDEIRKQMGAGSMDDLEKAAKDQGVSFEDFKDQQRSLIVSREVIGREVGGHIHITDDEVQAWYKAHQAELSSPEEVDLSEILIATQAKQPESKDKDKANAPLPEDPAKLAEAESKAQQIYLQLRAGDKFEDLAKKVSEGPTANQGGELGPFKRGELAKEFEDKTFSLKPGEYSDVLRTRQGFIIFKVNSHHQAGIPPIKEIDEKIRQAIYVDKLEPASRAFLTKLREEAYIEIKPGFTDTGASPNQIKPLEVANNDPAAATAAKSKKKKKFGVF